MKKFFNVFTIVMIVLFIVSAIATATAVPANWVAFVWVLIAFLWMVMSRGRELQKEQLKKDYEETISVLKTSRDNFMKSTNVYREKYRTKLDENCDLAARNKALVEDNLRLIKENLDLRGNDETLGSAPVEEQRGTHGNIKLKTKGKKKAAPKEKTEIKEKA